MQVKKGLSLVLSLVLAAQLCLPVGAAVANPPDTNPGTGEIVCTHHNQHTAECGYTAGTACTHAHTEACGVEGESCGHTHDAACGYTAGTPCTFDPTTCPDCNPQPPVPEVPAEPTAPVDPEMPPVPLEPALGAPKVELAAIDGAIDIGDPSRYIVITDTGYKIGAATTETPYKGAYVLRGTTASTDAPQVYYPGMPKYSKLKSHVVVNNTNGTPIKITLQSLNVSLAGGYGCAFSIVSGGVDLTLEGSSTLGSGEIDPGLWVGAGKRLTITAGSTGSLTAKTASTGGSSVGGSAGIGGRAEEAGGTITINGGTVTATGNSFTNEGGPGAGIGGGSNGAGGTITINGGTVTATGGKNGSDSVSGGAGIGGGSGGAGGIIAITGGVVTATGGNSSVPPFGGAGIGGGYIGSAGSFSATGNAAIFASNISDTSGYHNKTWHGMIFAGSIGEIYGNSFTLPGNITIPSGKNLHMTEGQILTVPPNTTLTVDGYIYKNGGKIVNNGIIEHPENILPVIPNNISVDYVNIGGNPIFPGSVPCTGTCKGHVITGTTDKHSISVAGGHHKITLLNTKIHNSTGNSAFTLLGDANVELTLVGDNMLLGTTNYAGLAVRQGNTLTITKESTGKLIANGGTYGAGIGGDYAGGVTCQPGTINIDGGEVTAIGGNQAAGIGGGYCGATTINTGIIAIDGGKVIATGGKYAAAIGGGYYGSGGTINILSGDVTANGGHCGAGIGGGEYAKGGNVYIKSGKVTATGGEYGAGIGSGSGEKNAADAYGANVTIDGGTVEANGGRQAAGIGGGYGCKSDEITINGGKVTAKGLGVSRNHGGAGIGGGYNGSGGKITITDGTVEATGGDQGAGIGGGDACNGATITINGGNVTATGANGSAGIGGGMEGGGKNGIGGSIAINGGDVIANGGGNEVFGGAGIGSGGYGGRVITHIYGGTVTANGAEGSAGIGSGKTNGDSTDGVTIGGGTVKATGGNNGPGIGGGFYARATPVTISGGTITANGGQNGAGIGGGNTNKGGTVTINGDAVIFATKGANAPDHIGNGASGSGASVSRTRGIIFEGSSNTGSFYGGNVTLMADATLPSRKNLTIPVGKVLTIPGGKTLTNNATLFLDGGSITGAGNIYGGGTFKIAMADSDIPTIPNQVYTGSPVTPAVIVPATHKILGKDFIVDNSGLTTRYENNINVGTATMVFTNGSSTFRRNFGIVPSSTTFESLKTYKDSTETPSFTYGDTITVKAKPKATGTAANSAKAFTPPSANQMALFLGDVQLCAPVNPDGSGVYTMTYNTADKKLALAYNTITAKYVGNPTMAGASGDVSVTLRPKALPSATVTSGSRVYDGSRDFANISLTLTGVESGDTVTATASGTAASADVGTHAFTASSTTLGGANANYYTLDPAAVSGSVRITTKPVTVTVTAQNKVYNGTTTATVTYAVIGKVGTDDVAATGTGAVFGNKNVGSKTVTVSDITINGAKKDNYALNNTTATATATITKKTIAWDGAGTVTSRPYDTTKSATVDTAPTLIGVESSDDVTVTTGTVTFANANVGTHAITVTGFGITGGDIGNYTAPAGQPTFANGTITAKQIIPTVAVTSSHTFDDRQQLPTVTVTDGTTTPHAIIPATEYTASYGENVSAGTDAGSVTVTLKGNYSGSADKTFTIAKASRDGVVITKPILMKANETHSIPLPAISNAGDVTYTVTTITDIDKIFSANPTIVGTNLTFTCALTAGSEKTATVVITVKSNNYNDFTVTQTFEVTGKTTVTITGLTAADGLTYNGSAQQGYAGTITAKNGEVLVADLVYTYTYTGIGGTTYVPTSTPPTEAGSYMLTIDANHTSYTGSHKVITFTIAPQKLTVTPGTYKVTKVWNGTTAKGTGSGDLGCIGGVPRGTTITPTLHDYPSDHVNSSYSVIVDLTLTDASGNYALANNTVPVPGTITKSAVLPAKPSAPALAAANEVSVRLQTVTVDGETVEYAKNTTDAAPTAVEDWQPRPDFGGLTAATTYYFFARVKDNDNHPAGAASIGTAITTQKAVHTPVAPKSIIITNGAQRTGTVTLANVFGANVPDGAAFGEPVGSANVLQSFTRTNDSTLFYTSKNNPASTSATDVFTVPITSKGYEEITLTVSFSTSEKVSAIITATVESKKYDGNAMERPNPTATSGGSSVELGYTYQWQKNGAPISDAPKDVGSYALVITGENGDSVGSLTIPFMIVKRALTVTATNAEIKAGAAVPMYAHTESGLAGSETLTGVSVTCSYKNDNSASSIAGHYPITMSGGTVSGGGNGNYAITYVPGTLTVTLDTTALNNAITATEALKVGIEVLDKTPGEVENGKRFVTSPVMTALENTITAAKEVVRDLSAPPQKLAAAMSTLAQAADTFKAAIQTGTYSPGGGSWEPAPKPKPEPEKPSADKFTDIKGHWAEESIKFVVAEGLFNGISDTAFAPDKNMTRGMLVTVLYRQAGTPATTTDGSAWYSSAQAWAMQSGISDGTNMEREMTRQELVTMLYRYAKQIGIDVSVGEDTNILSYNDAFDLPQWSIPAFQWACGAGIVEGVGENLLPTNTATRAQVATMLQRFAGLTAAKV